MNSEDSGRFSCTVHHRHQGSEKRQHGSGFLPSGCSTSSGPGSNCHGSQGSSSISGGVSLAASGRANSQSGGENLFKFLFRVTSGTGSDPSAHKSSFSNGGNSKGIFNSLMLSSIGMSTSGGGATSTFDSGLESGINQAVDLTVDLEASPGASAAPPKRASIGFYKGNIVYMKHLYKKNIDLTRSIRKELITVSLQY